MLFLSIFVSSQEPIFLFIPFCVWEVLLLTLKIGSKWQFHSEDVRSGFDDSGSMNVLALFETLFVSDLQSIAPQLGCLQ